VTVQDYRHKEIDDDDSKEELETYSKDIGTYITTTHSSILSEFIIGRHLFTNEVGLGLTEHVIHDEVPAFSGRDSD